MNTIVIEGQHRLSGRVQVSGAKNSAIALLPATLLTNETCILRGIPHIADVDVVNDILRTIGVHVQHHANVCRIYTGGNVDYEIPYNLGKKIRASALFLGPLLARFGVARVALPGGCDIGSRPLDLHIKGFEEMGATVRIEHGYLVGDARGGLVGDEIYLDFPSVGATENIMMAATLARGTTTVYNAAKEPEVVDLANLLTLMGASVKGAGTDIIRIRGVDGGLHSADHTIIPDRIEAGTYLMAALITGGEILLENVIPKHLEAILAKLEDAGVCLEVGDETIHAWCEGPIQPVQVKTLPYPGFPTDLQPQLTSLMTVAAGTSIINERIFENRFSHVDELKRLGGQIKTDGRSCVVEGVADLSGAPVTATDLRMGAALVTAALAAKGKTQIDGFEHVRRGYEDMPGKLARLGAVVYEIDNGLEGRETG